MSDSKTQKSNAVRIQELETHLTTLAQAVQGLQTTNKVMQSLSKQTMTNLMNLSDEMKDLNRALSDAQYFIHVLKKHASITDETLNSEAALLQIKDFNEAIAKEDEAEGLVPAEFVDEDSVVVITSSTPGLTPDKGFLRSRLDLQQVSIKDFRDNILGKKTNDSFSCEINGTQHQVTLLSVKKKPNEATQDGLPVSETAH